MLIDWFTVVAQILNFLVLVWLLKRFLYQPISKAIAEREQRIAKQLADAAAQRQLAQTEHDEFIRKNTAFDEQRGVLLSKATEAANIERERLLRQAHEVANALSQSRHAALVTEAAQLNQLLLRRVQREVFAIARKSLQDLAGVSLDARVVDVFILRLAAMESAIKDTLIEALTDGTDPLLIRSAFELPRQQQATIQSALEQTFAMPVTLRFEMAPDLVGGIELLAAGQKLGWTIGGYLDSLESGVDDVLKQQVDAAQPPARSPTVVAPSPAVPAHDAALP